MFQCPHMKLSFSTLGCPDWSLEQVIARAAQWGYDGVEIRGIQGELDLTRAEAFSDRKINDTRRRLVDHGIEICCLGSSSQFHMEDVRERQENVDSARAHVELAERLHVPFVRVFGDRFPDPYSKAACIDRVGEALQALSRFAGEVGVRIVLETHGDFTLSSDIAAVMKRAESPYVGVLWDTHHPYRTSGESVEITIKQLRPWIWHTHFKDSLPEGDGHRYVLPGQGDVPIPSFVERLRAIGYTGYLSFEWEKRWHPEIEEPEVAFPRYVQYMQAYL